MTIDQVGQVTPQQAAQAQPAQPLPVQQQAAKDPPIINSNEIRAILYLGIRGKISLPVESHKVDVLA